MTQINENISKLNKDILDVDKLIKDGKDLIRILQTASKRVDNKYAYPKNKILRGNALGNFIRGSKHNAINKSVDRSQEEILAYREKLLLFDKSLADILILPSKMTEFSGTSSKLGDIALSTNMRLRELEINKSKRSVEKIVRRLISRRKKLDYELKKHKEYKDL